MKRLFALILLFAMMTALVACGGSNQTKETVQTLPTIETAPQKEYTSEEAIDIFNQAVEKIEQAQSYKMTGSVNSTAVMSTSMATVVTSIDCDYADNNGSPTMLMKSAVNDGSKVTDHVTYVEDGKYYFEVMGLKYYTSTNDYTDYHATHYLKQVEAKDVSGLEIRDELDGKVSVQFTVPYGVYQSEAVTGWLGYMGEDVDKQPITVRVEIAADGTIANFYMTLASVLSFGNDTIEQTIVLSMNLSGYNATEVIAPADLASYENWDGDSGTSSGGQNPEGDGHNHGDVN